MVVFDAIFILVSIILGVVLALSGKPYRISVFTVHKLTALGAVILTSIVCYNSFKIFSVSGFYTLAMVIAGVSSIALFVSGALMSSENAAYHIFRITHIVSSIVLTACIVGIMIHIVEELR
jgi:hypothetical protein